MRITKKRKEKTKKFNLIFRKCTIIIAFSIILFLSFNEFCFAYWFYNIEGANTSKQISITIGRWIYGIIIYDPDNKVDISSGDYVLRDMPDGTQRIFYAQRNIPNNDQYHDPLNPATSWIVPVRYLDCSGNWQRYHTYNRKDLTIYNGQVYEYTYRIAHTANTTFAKNPDEQPTRWSLKTDLTPDSNVYFRYKVYMEGDIVVYNNSSFQCIVNASVNVEPKNNSPNWTKL